MNITTAQAQIDQALEMGVINSEQAVWRGQMIRRTERYGNKMHWAEQARMRVLILNDLPALTN